MTESGKEPVTCVASNKFSEGSTSPNKDFIQTTTSPVREKVMPFLYRLTISIIQAIRFDHADLLQYVPKLLLLNTLYSIAASTLYLATKTVDNASEVFESA
jgi:flagellar biosynthesis protein FliQ